MCCCSPEPEGKSRRKAEKGWSGSRKRGYKGDKRGANTEALKERVKET